VTCWRGSKLAMFAARRIVDLLSPKPESWCCSHQHLCWSEWNDQCTSCLNLLFLGVFVIPEALDKIFASATRRSDLIIAPH
jgi:hypothetical protein